MRIFEDWTGWDDVEAALAGRVTPDDLATLRRAYDDAVEAHGDQRRPTGVPYVHHLLEALQVLTEGAGVHRIDPMVATLLHDVAEDTTRTIAGIEAAFGPVVAGLVDWVTKPEPDAGESRRAAKERYLRRLAAAPPDAILVKLADRTSNVQTLDRLEPERRRRRYYAETVELILPLTAGVPWFETRFAEWREAHAHLA
jgi:(p)ppGpp synthase/HD superfamily hydrolase